MSEKPIIIHDGPFDIATGRSRKETSWKNKQMHWSAFVEKLSTTHRTVETHIEYLAAKPHRQDEIKDIGGFVGGYLTSGRRKAGSVMHRQIITLDLDFATSNVWGDFTMLYGCGAVLYSTHKHSPIKPRLRLVIILDRPVRPDEYEAIARRIAGVLDIELFDPTTFQPERLMYWPSTSKGAEYIYQVQDGQWLNADEILSSYHDWRDSSAWPVSEKIDKLLQRSIAKQGDPLEKSGVIGAFCRTYSIPEVIEMYLTDVYDACDVENRYTYREGSGANGLVVYDDKFAYSHHGTDPTSGILCNAFDLVRRHKFGLKGEKASNDAMIDLATKDPKVRKLIALEKSDSANEDFKNSDAIEANEEPENDVWKEKLDVDKKGNYYNTIDNVTIIFENDPYFKNKIAYDDFEKCEVALKNLPWRKIKPITRRLIDSDDANIRHYLENKYGISSPAKIKDGLDITLKKNSVHPVKKYLNEQKWDGVSRVDTLFIDFLGAEDSPYIKAVTRKTLVAAVARIFRPGAKFDYVLTLIGKQGIGKSTIIKKLGKIWCSDSFGNLQNKDALEAIQGVWLMEIGELAGLKKGEIDTIKHFISKQEDRYRVAYGKRLENFPRQCIFFGTTNNREFLQDPTGNRRFWPVDTMLQAPTKNLFKDFTDYEIDQVWAEAVELYKKGEEIHLSKEMEIEANKIQDRHSEIDERAGIVQQYLDKLLPDDWREMNTYQRRSYLAGDEIQAIGTVRRKRVCVAEIWYEAFSSLPKDMSTFNTKSIHTIMRKMEGWVEGPSKGYVFKLYGNQKAYFRKETPKIACTVGKENEYMKN